MRNLRITKRFAAGLAVVGLACCTESPTCASEPAEQYDPGNNPIYRKGWIDFNKNGRKDVYEDPEAALDDRIEDLLSQMTVEEKTCQLVTLYGYKRVLQDSLPTPGWKDQLWKDGLGAIDEHLNGFVQWGKSLLDCDLVWPASRHAWAINETQRFFVEETRLGIPVDMTNEGIRGVEAYRATNFPSQLGMGHTWNRELLRKTGRIVGREARLLGYTNIYAPVLDVGRDQRWGRYEEVFGESPYLVAELGVAMASGMQTDYQVASTAKHFAAYSNNKGAREGMSRVDPQMPPREVENIHLIPFREVIRRAGILGVMSSYNDYDGVPIQGSRYWLTERLRGEMGFRGYVVSDSGSVEYLHNKHHTAVNQLDAVRQSIEAGLNVRCNFWHPETYVMPLRQLFREGLITEELLDSRVRDVLRVKFLVGLFDRPYQTDLAAADREVDGPEHNEVALQASRESIVLLKNENSTLPLDARKIRRIAVLGPNADARGFALGHYGPLAVEVTSVLDGLKKNLGARCEIVYEKGCELVDAAWPLSEIFREEMTPEEKAGIRRAAEAASESDVAVVVLGGGSRTCGENCSRSSLDLPGRQEELLRAVEATGKPTVLVMINGRPNSINWADAHVDAIVEAWYPGAHGGQAVYEVLFGEYNPGGKLTVTFPRHVGQIPFNFPYKPAANTDGGLTPGPGGNQTRINGALYDFGYGLSYTTFEYADLRIEPQTIRQDEPFRVSFDVTNTGQRDGDEVVQLYIHDVLSSVTTYEKNLRGFDRVHLKAGETRRVTMQVRPQDLSLLNERMERVVEPGDFDVLIGASSTDIRLKATVTVDGEGPVAPKEEIRCPYALDKGGSLILPTGGDGRPEGVEIRWSKDSEGTFEVQLMSGGGQFLTVGSYPIRFSRSGTLYRFRRTNASEMRILITEGRGRIEALRVTE